MSLFIGAGKHEESQNDFQKEVFKTEINNLQNMQQSSGPIKEVN